MPRKEDSQDLDKSRSPGKTMSPQEIQDEIAFIRQRCNSLSMRGHYPDCIKTIEENLAFFYTGERWPENFFSILRLHQKCYPSLNKDQDHSDYIAVYLKKNQIPHVFCKMLKERDNALVWTSEHFRDRAVQCESGGKLEDALSYCDLLIKMEPSSSNAYLIRGRILDKMNRDKDALAMYECALEMSPGNRGALNLLARHYIKTNPKYALEFVEKAIAKSPDEAANYALRAEIYVKMGKEDEAIASIDESIKLDPYNPAYPHQKGEIHYAKGNKMAAIPQYRLAVACNEKYAPSLTRLCELCFDAQPDLALGYISTVVAAEPQNRDAALKKAKLLHRTGASEAAVRQFRAVLELDPDCADAHAGLGEIYLRAEDAQRAVAELEEAVRLAPGQSRFLLQKGRAHKALDQREQAVETYRAVTVLEKENASAWGELGFLFSETKPREALGYFEKALAIDPVNAFYYAGIAELPHIPPDKRESALALACQYDPGNGELHAKMGLLMEETGKLASAMNHYKKAVHLCPDDAEICFRLARLEMDTRPDLAYLHIDKAIAMSVTRGEYYFIKARVILALQSDSAAFANLRENLVENKDFAMAQDLNSIAENDFLRISLVFIDRALELDAQNPVFLCLRAYLFYQMGQKPKALSEYQKILAVDPNQQDALFGMARILANKKGEEKKALEYFNKAIAVAPGVAEYHAEKASFLQRDDASYTEALEEYTIAIACNNRAWLVILEKARLFDRHGDEIGAMTEYRRVLLLRADCVEASARMGMILAGYRPDFAVIYLNQAVKLEPGNYLHYLWRVKARQLLGNEEGAQEDLMQAVTLGEDTPQTNAAIAEVLQETLPDTALEFIRKALEQDDAKAAYFLLCGQLFLAREAFEEARVCYERALVLDAGRHEIHENVARLAWMERLPEARERVDAALENKKDCPVCLYIKTCILDEVEDDVPSALEFIGYAIRLEPDNLLLQEKYVALLEKKRSLIKLALEKRRLEKMRKKQGVPPEIPEPPSFEELEKEGAEESAPETHSAPEAGADLETV